MNCSICVERFNKSTHSEVLCPFCSTRICSECVEHYLLDLAEDPKCMNCRKAWSFEIMNSCGLSKKFVGKTYRKHREDILYERERSLMILTQPKVEREIYSRKVQNISMGLVAENVELGNRFNRLNTQTLASFAEERGIEDPIQAIQLKADEAFIEHRKIWDNLSNVAKNDKILVDLKFMSVDPKISAKKFIRACPHENCLGFLNNVWKCGVCENWTCPECHEVKGEDKNVEHTCKPECVASAAHLKKDCKGCPKCGSLIFKIDGCDQIWCPQCGTAFSWRTGQIETGRVHTPLYYDYMKKGLIAPHRTIGDIPCGGMPTVQDMNFPLSLSTHVRNKCYSIIRNYDHITYHIMPKYTTILQNCDTEELRIKFMLKDIDEEKFKTEILLLDRKKYKVQSIQEVLNTYQIVMADTMLKFRSDWNADDAFFQFENIREFTNERSDRISTVYNCSTPHITTMYEVRFCTASTWANIKLPV